MIKKICILCASDKPIPATKGGAIETLIQNLIDENEKQHKYYFTLLTIEDKNINYIKYKYTEFVKIPAKVLKLNKIYWKIVGAIRKIFNVEILSPIQRRWEYKFLKKNYKKFDLIIEEIDLQTIKKLKNKIKNKIIYHEHYDKKADVKEDKTFDYLMPISTFIGKQWQKRTNREKSTIFELKNCIKIDDFKRKLTEEEKVKLKQKLKISEDNTVAIYVGRIIPEKGVMEMLQAIKKANLKNFTLILIGSSNFEGGEITEYENKINNYIKTMKTQVVKLGYIKNKEVYKYQNISDFAIIPSVWEEPAGLVVLEAEVAGLPVIASNTGGIPEFFCKEAGILVDKNENFIDNLSNAILEMINNKNNYNEMGKMGIKWSQKFNSKEYYKNFSTIIEKLL